MKPILALLLFVFSLINTAHAETMSDTLITHVINKKLPTVLYLKDDIKWDLGFYSLQINKAGSARITSGTHQLSATLPITAKLNGKVIQKLMGTELIMKCSSTVDTEGHIQIIPTLKPTGSTAKVEISVPIPESELNCDGLRIPIKAALEKIIRDNKVKWQTELETEINSALKDLGL